MEWQLDEKRPETEQHDVPSKAEASVKRSQKAKMIYYYEL